MGADRRNELCHLPIVICHWKKLHNCSVNGESKSVQFCDNIFQCEGKAGERMTLHMGIGELKLALFLQHDANIRSHTHGDLTFLFRFL